MLRIFKQYYPIRNIFFVTGEFFVIYLSAFCAEWIVDSSAIFFNDWLIYIKIFLIAFICQTCLYYNELYDLTVTDSFSELSIRLLQSLGATTIILAMIYAVFPDISIGFKVFAISIGFDIVFIVSWRFCYTLVLNKRLFDQKVVIFGSGELARNIIDAIIKRRDCGYMIAGIVLEGRDDADYKMRRMLMNLKDVVIIGFKDQDGLCDEIKNMEITKVIISLTNDNDLPTKELLKCRVNGIDVTDGNSFYEMLTGKLIVDHIKPEWLIFSDGFRQSRGKRLIKRSIDLFLSVVLLILLLPVVLIVALFIKLDRYKPERTGSDIWRCLHFMSAEKKLAINEIIAGVIKDYLNEKKKLPAVDLWENFKKKCQLEDIDYVTKFYELLNRYIDGADSGESKKNPVFFAQERVGKNGKTYMIYKFRSMIVDAEKYSGPVWAGEDDNRITRVGRFIRKWRIDEIPQVWNVLKGEMSFVGPRPEREHFVRQLERFIPYYRERLTVKPGITGWAQVCYGYGATEDDAKEKLNYDLFYIKNMSIPMDLMIVLRTIKIVIFGKGR